MTERALIPLAYLVTVAAAYVWPIDRPAAPTSTFGEYRSRHFHGGLDLSTDQTDGVPVRALEDGEVARVRASGTGYGRSIYLHLSDGRTAVYGHLDGYAPDLARWVDSVQDSTGQYEQDLTPPSDQFRYRRGEVVGYSGESGAGPPHLHVELRQGETGLNPLVFGLPVPDRVAPTIHGIWVYPAGPEGRVESVPSVLRVGVTHSAGYARAARPIRVSGPVRVAVEVTDRTQERPNEMGAYAVTATLDGDTVYQARLDSVSWLETVESEIVFDPRAREAGATLAYALTPALPIRCFAVQRAVSAWSRPPGDHALVVTAEDASGNRSRLDAMLTWVGPGATPDGGWKRPARRPSRELEFELVPGGMALRYPSGRGVVPVTRPNLPVAGPVMEAPWSERVFELPAGALGAIRLAAVRGAAETLEVRSVSVAQIEAGWSQTVRSPDGAFQVEFGTGSAFERTPVAVERVSGGRPGGAEPSDPMRSAYRVEPSWLPVRDPVRVSLRFADTLALDRMGLFQVGEGAPRFVGGRDSADAHVLAGSTRRLGSFRALPDFVPPRLGNPRVRPSPRPDAPDVRPRPLEVRWSVGDVGSGLAASDMILTVDGRRVAVEYDSEGGTMGWRPLLPPIPGTHAYRVEVTDRLGNRSSREGTFRIPGTSESPAGKKESPRHRGRSR